MLLARPVDTSCCHGEASELELMLDGPKIDFPLFASPREPIDLAEYAAGLHVARTVADGGESFYIQGDHRVTVPHLYHAALKSGPPAITHPTIFPGVP